MRRDSNPDQFGYLEESIHTIIKLPKKEKYRPLKARSGKQESKVYLVPARGAVAEGGLTSSASYNSISCFHWLQELIAGLLVFFSIRDAQRVHQYKVIYKPAWIS